MPPAPLLAAALFAPPPSVPLPPAPPPGPAADLARLPADDPRNIAFGREIPSEGYCDQPYVVKTADGGWLCVMTTGPAEEGGAGQHVVAVRSADRGRTWSAPVDVEPASGPAASWAVPLLAPAGSAVPGRVFVFYTYNAAGLTEVKADHGVTDRVDTLGEYACRYSDDGGRSWSPRFFLPVRAGAIDRANPYGGAVRFFWGVGKPAVIPAAGGAGGPGAVLLPFTKVGRFGAGFLAETEAWFLRGDDLLAAADPAAAAWATLPAGDRGLTAPAGPIASEPSVAVLSDGSLFCCYRTVAGHPGAAYSRDGGRTWTPPAFLAPRPGAPPLDHPRAANFVWKLSAGPHAGGFLYWFHDHPGRGYAGRNPAYLLAGEERDGPGGRTIVWGEPEVGAVLDGPGGADQLPGPDRGRRPSVSHRNAEDRRPRPRTAGGADRPAVRVRPGGRGMTGGDAPAGVTRPARGRLCLWEPGPSRCGRRRCRAWRRTRRPPARRRRSRRGPRPAA